MKIIFDSKEQMNEFLTGISEHVCPGEFPTIIPEGRNMKSRYCNIDGPCSECWATCGIEMEVKSLYYLNRKI